MGLLDFLTGKGKAAPVLAGATDTAAAPPDAIKKELEAHGFDTSKVEIKVDGGKVTLSGTTATADQAERMVVMVGNTKGVAQVENNLKASDGAVAGENFYVVKSGDTLWKIAEAQYGHGHGAKYQEIFEANKPMLKDPDHIYPGQRLRIPGASGGPAASAGGVKTAGGAWAPPSEIANKG